MSQLHLNQWRRNEKWLSRERKLRWWRLSVWLWCSVGGLPLVVCYFYASWPCSRSNHATLTQWGTSIKSSISLCRIIKYLSVALERAWRALHISYALSNLNKAQLFIYDEVKTQLVKVLALHWEKTHQDISKGPPHKLCLLFSRFPFFRAWIGLS